MGNDKSWNKYILDGNISMEEANNLLFKTIIFRMYFVAAVHLWM
jgi:hypothetical protein